MNEASKLSPFMTSLRENLPGAVVVKHRDGSMIGMVDFSVTWKRRTMWGEAKLYELPKRKEMTVQDWLRKAKEESPTQAGMAERLNQTSVCLYFIWIKKTKLIVISPSGEAWLEFDEPRASARGVQFVKDFFEEFDAAAENWR